MEERPKADQYRRPTDPESEAQASEERQDKTADRVSEELKRRYLEGTDNQAAPSEESLSAAAKEQADRIERLESDLSEAVQTARAIRRSIDRKIRRLAQIAHISTVIGTTYLTLNTERPSDRVANASETPDSHEISFELDNLSPELSDARLKKLVEKTLPASWSKDVSKIGFDDRDEKVNEEYNLDETSFATASTLGGGDTEIVFYRPARKESPVFTLGVALPHEMAHANDWVRDDDMTPERRRDVETSIRSRLKSETRYRSSYVESIHNDDPETQMSSKAAEYWAVIHQIYLSAEKPEQILPTPDIDIIESNLRQTDPKFDREAAYAARQEIINQVLDERLSRLLTERLEAGPEWIQTKKQEIKTAILKANKRQRLAAKRLDDQPKGRADLLNAIKKYAPKGDERSLFRLLIRAEEYSARAANELNTGNDSSFNGSTVLIKANSEMIQRIIQRMEPQAVEEVKRDFSKIIDGEAVGLGYEFVLKRGEREQLLDRESHYPEWLVDLAGWQEHPDDSYARTAHFLEKIKNTPKK